MKSLLALLASLLLILTACKKAPDAEPDPENMHIGFWTNPIIIDSVWTYTRVNSLPDNDYGFAIVRNGLFVERKNAGFCGTPPITYAEYEGSWTKSGNILTISTKYWGGSEQYIWKIRFCDQKKLSVIRLQ